MCLALLGLLLLLYTHLRNRLLIPLRKYGIWLLSQVPLSLSFLLTHVVPYPICSFFYLKTHIFPFLMYVTAFLIYVAITMSIVLALILHFEPLCGQTNILVYIGICSLMGALTVSWFISAYSSFYSILYCTCNSNISCSWCL